MRYDRALHAGFESLLASGGVLRPLVEYCRTPWRNYDLVPDLQLREKNKVGIYLGLTRVLELQMESKGNIKPTASDAYRMDKHGVGREYGPGSYDRLAVDILRYLEEVEVRPTFLTGEGRCQNWLSSRYGVRRKASHGELLSIDREVVIGYDNTDEKQRRWGEAIRKPALALAKTISESDPRLYGERLHERPLGNEFDLLAWEPPDTFLCVEAKRGQYTHGIYMAPLQVAAYAVAWRDSDWDRLADGVRRLVEQKRDLGLISMSDSECEMFEKSLEAPRFLPAIVIQNPNRRGLAWKRLAEVLTYIENGWPEGWGNNVLGSLRIYSVDEQNDSLLDITQECLTW